MSVSAFSQVAQPVHDIFNAYDDFKVSTFTHKRFTQKQLQEFIFELPTTPEIDISLAGKSLENREIYHITIGNGPIHILAWSQMHGNESTATMALMDLLLLFTTKGQFDDWKDELLNKVSLHFIPMLNPDGAEVYKRQNALGIDINRDAQRLQSPESQILKRLRDELEPEFGFNLHDQGRYYAVGQSDKPATISFLAPAYDEEKSTNEVRENAMKLISILVDTLQHHIPGYIAKYNDTYEPRAFGDRIQGWGTSTILIESGGFPGDREKQFIRKLNFLALLTSFQVIASNSYSTVSTELYQQLPFNNRRLYDLIIRSAQWEVNDRPYTVDLGINYSEISPDSSGKTYLRGNINYIGDLSTSAGYQELQAEGLTIHQGKIYQPKKSTLGFLSSLNFTELLLGGYTYIRLEEPLNSSYSPYPLNLISPGKEDPTFDLGLYVNPNFLLKGDGKIKYSVVNGFIFDHLTREISIENGLHFTP